MDFLAHNFIPVANFILSNFWYDRISKISPCIKQQEVKTWSKTSQKWNFVSIIYGAIMMKLGGLIDFYKRKNLQKVSLFSHNLCVFFILALKSLLWRHNCDSTDQYIYFYFMASSNLIPLLETKTLNFRVLTLLVCKVQKVCS